MILELSLFLFFQPTHIVNENKYINLMWSIFTCVFLDTQLIYIFEPTFLLAGAKLFCQKVVLWNEAKDVNHNVCGFKYFFFTLYVSLAWAKAASFFFFISNTTILGMNGLVSNQRNKKQKKFKTFHVFLFSYNVVNVQPN